MNKLVTKFSIIISGAIILLLMIIIVTVSISLNKLQNEQVSFFTNILQNKQNEEQKILYDNLELKSKSLLVFLCDNLKDVILNYDYERLKILLSEAEKDSEIAYISIKTPDGEILYQPKEKISDAKISQKIEFKGEVLAIAEIGIKHDLVKQKCKELSLSIKNMVDVNFKLKEALKNKFLVKVLLLSITSLLCILGIIYYLLTLIITAPIEHLVLIADNVAKENYDYTVNLKSNDEIGILGRYLNIMIKSLKEKKNEISNKINHLNEILLQVAETSKNLSNSAVVLSRASHVLGTDASSQLSSLNNVSQLVDFGLSQSRKNASYSSEGDSIANLAYQSVEEAQSQMSEMVNSIMEMKTSSIQIIKVINTIEQIASETSLLALNASIEAARAGNYGRGFAVVAEEVSNLASSTAKSSAQIEELITDSVSKIEKSTEISNLTANSLKTIVEYISKTKIQVSEIASISKEHAISFEQINKAVHDMNFLTKHNSDNANEIAASAENILIQAMVLKDLISKFSAK
ncbi:MAG: methyl-accepting chemotaxis sensory transducer with Pas/Pac sensor [uncultured bacterium]|nr:MAG: methyl-accepting chemotaxis sensory transducer with Pas/Pac sensor [uncultured bacterium]